MIDGRSFGEEALLARSRPVTVCVPALDEAPSIARTVHALRGLVDRGAVDHLIVLDGGSADDTVEQAKAGGAEVRDMTLVRPELGPVLGKGDSMWRSLAVVETPVVVYVDADIHTDLVAMVCGLAGPLVAGAAAGPGAAARFVKGAFRRRNPDFVSEHDAYDGGRVTEMVARPLLNLLRPDLAHFYQPLGGQVAGEVSLLRSIPMLTGYAVEIAMLVDVVDRVGSGAVVEVDLGELRNRPRPTAELAPMAQEVLYGFLRRVGPGIVEAGWQPYRRPRFGGGFDEVLAHVVERPPMDAG